MLRTLAVVILGFPVCFTTEYIDGYLTDRILGKLVVVGDQSSSKSSGLEGLRHRSSFPTTQWSLYTFVT
jgi:hypothetical protein